MSSEVALPIEAVTLFASGVAYIERGGVAPVGDARASLLFRTAQVNDILKSLVLLDETGSAQPIVYPSRDPIGRTLQTFAVDVSQNRSLADLLREVRGAEIHILTIGNVAHVGRIVGVEEAQELTADRDVVYVTRVTLLTDDGLQSVPLARVETLRLLDERLDRELREALIALAGARDEQRRQIALQFRGETERTVRVGYIVESPVWKVSYRLVLEEKERPYLQGWAIVENTSDDDWENVELSLVSGRPVSFVQDLYAPLYVTRPTVPVDSDGVAAPQLHGSALEGGAVHEGVATLGWMEEEQERGLSAPRRAMMAAAAPAPMMAGGGGRARIASVAKMEIAQPQATGQQTGELFAYEMSEPVNLPRQRAALIPILSQRIGGEKLSLYNANTDARFPRNAVRIVNDTDLHLKAGAVTIFDGGTYAGDARIENVPPKDSRLVTYAVDLAVECERQSGGPTVVGGGTGRRATETTVRVRGGLLEVSTKRQSITRYTFKNKSDAPKIVLVEHPFDANATLISPRTFDERTAEYWRFRVTVAAHVTDKLEVVLEMPQSQSVALVDGSLELLIKIVEGKTISVATRRALTDILNRRRAIQNKQMELGNAEQEQAQIVQEQERVRANLAAVDNQSALYKRYMDTLDAQETRLAELRTRAQTLRGEVQTLTTALIAYTDTLELGD